ncbi:MAG: hydrogenase formation protein HypD [Desulfovibrionaceae bacterium]|nr:hydrogenase formation protein HypD [Desulfovibrionaceae bacterium]
MSLIKENDPQICQDLLKKLDQILDGRPMRFMEVCGTHTVAIFQSGLRSLLPKNLTHLSGPGCPVCVTHDAEIAAFLELAKLPKVILTTFGDLLRVPGPEGLSLKHARAEGGRVEIVYSPLEALNIAKKHPDSLVVFLGIGFETTAPTVAATLAQAWDLKLDNFCVFSLHKLVPPVLRALLEDTSLKVDAFLLPGHVSTIIGIKPYQFIADEFHLSGVVGGFSPQEILLALCKLAQNFVGDKPQINNAYPKAVEEFGNVKAQALMEEFFEPTQALWRGLGSLEGSGLALRPKYQHFDARVRLDLKIKEVPPLKGCKCGEVLKGVLTPKECPLFGKKCTPANPVGPCMVSTEGSCAAWFKYDM